MSSKDDYAEMMFDAAPQVLRRLGLCPRCAGDSEPRGSGNLCRECRAADEAVADQELAHLNRVWPKRTRRQA